MGELMEVWAEICGWSRRMEVSPEILRRGILEVELLPPLDLIVPSEHHRIPPKYEGTIIKLYLERTGRDNLPLFRYR